MLGLDVTIDTKSGFCFGVEYAIEIAEEILQQDGELYCLGDIVHNDMEVKRLEDMGLKIIDHDELKKMKDVKVLIRAHGEPPSTYDLAIKNNITLMDASCPVVLKLQNRIKKSHDKKEKIYIYGKHGHPEVKGLMGQTGKDAIVFQDIKELDGKINILIFSDLFPNIDKIKKINENFRQAKGEGDQQIFQLKTEYESILQKKSELSIEQRIETLNAFSKNDNASFSLET